jgi:hypothetical protein
LTGGRIIRETNDIDVRIAKSMDESSAYYAISYYPSNHEWDGKFRRIRVVVQNPQLSAIAREGYYAVLDSSPAPEDLDRLLSLAVINPLSYHSLQIQARARLSGTQQQRTAHLEVTLDANRLHWETPAADNRPCEITVVAAGFSTKGVLVTHALKEFQINVDEKKYARLTKTGMLMGLSMPIPPAAVRMRVVVRDSTNGNMGTADLTPEGDQFH